MDRSSTEGHQRFGRAQQTQQMVADVRAAPTLAKHRGGQDAQAKGIVQLAVGQQTTVRGDPSTVELEPFVSPVASAGPPALSL
jgi:hypothetical protein